MANTHPGEVVNLRQVQEDKLCRAASKALRDPRASSEEKELAMDRYIAFSRQTIRANSVAGLYDYKEQARFFKDED